MLSGRLPFKLFPDRARFFKEDMLKTTLGIWPFRALNCIDKNCSSILPISFGISENSTHTYYTHNKQAQHNAQEKQINVSHTYLAINGGLSYMLWCNNVRNYYNETLKLLRYEIIVNIFFPSLYIRRLKLGFQVNY